MATDSPFINLQTPAQQGNMETPVDEAKPDWKKCADEADASGSFLLSVQLRNQAYSQQKITDDIKIAQLRAEVADLRRENELHVERAKKYPRAESMKQEAARKLKAAHARETLVMRQYALIDEKINSCISCR
ncbi:unnamed protein product [Phytophthora lilii]|uniref:Unnamed protein product n=1 Tax=Phytophthora lilii TaxID=2077276 RepID=A0A9W6TWV3_9STRA|nr:unnamed protein product [Phytophthora lilii]